MKQQIIKIINSQRSKLYLYYNNKKPYWKKKPLGLIPANSFVIYENFHFSIENCYVKYEDDEKINEYILLTKFDGFLSITEK